MAEFDNMRERDWDECCPISEDKHNLRMAESIQTEISGWAPGARSRTRRRSLEGLTERITGSWPLVARDLRGMSRQGQVFWIRVLGAGMAIVTLALLLLQEVHVGASLGVRIFSALNTCVIFTILFVGPVITADCIAQEKREGTLGLLFLAPLRSRDIVLAKALSNALRAFTLLLAVIPVMVFPVVFGGVPAYVLIFALSSQLAALCIALAAGILASIRNREFIQAAVWGIIYCLCLVGVVVLLSRALMLLSRGFRSPALASIMMFVSLAFTVAVAIAVLLWVLRYASRNLKRRWRRESTDFKPPRWIRSLSDVDEWRAFFAWDTQKARSTNPIAWLQEYSWTARLAKWGWCILALIGQLYVLLTGTLRAQDRGAQLALAAIVALGIALSGANSFRAERLTGAMELLLVAPISTIRLIGGRLWGVWVHFFPAVAIIGFSWFVAAPLFGAQRPQAWLLASTYLFLPMVGLYLSMFPWNVLVAWLVIYLAGAVLPFLIGSLFRHQMTLEHSVAISVSLQAFLGLTAVSLLAQKLRTRNFVFQNGRE
jgi:ABC-type transport system involved in multi-copper enzyme maturation permease subunit